MAFPDDYGMIEQQESGQLHSGHSNRKQWFWLRLAIFTAITAAVLTYGIYVLTPKYPYGIISLLQYYRTDPETVDVLAVGTSLTYTDLNTNILWSEYGIACFDLASAEQPYWSTYYYLREAFRYGKPKVVLLDLKAITYQEDKVSRTRTILCSYGIRNPVDRWRCIAECVEPEEFWSYAMAYPQVHSNYEGVTGQDFAVTAKGWDVSAGWKGYIEKNALTSHVTPEMDFTFNTARNVNAHEQEFFEKILELCKKEDVPVMLIGYPNADYMHDHYFYCSAFEIAQQYGVTGINYNLPEDRPKINYSTDCADWQHLNICGSAVFTRALGKDLKELYQLEDHRGDPAYASYDLCADEWFSTFPQFDRRNRQ